MYARGKYDWTLRCLRKAGIAKSTTIANIGCGAGHFSSDLIRHGYRCDSFEPDPVAFAIAQKRLSMFSSVYNTGIFDIPDHLQYEMVTMHDVLEHIEDDSTAISRLGKMIKPGGHLIITVPAMQSLFGSHDEQLGHFRRYSRKSLKSLMQGEFEILTVRYYGFLSIPIVWVVSKKLRRGYPATAADGKSMLARMYRIVCGLESRVAGPLGTSLLLLARRRS